MTSVNIRMVGSENGDKHDDSPDVIIVNPNSAGAVPKKPPGRRVSQYFGDYSSVDLSWENVSVDVHMKRGVLCFQKDLGRKQILENVSGYARSGQVLAIMGSSGCGKSTLLNALAGRSMKDMRVKGDICANGQPLGRDIAHIASYIQQEDLFIGTLTVRETLLFQANLRLGHLSTEEKKTRIEEMIAEGELTKVADSLVGVPGSEAQSLSGGERKRLSLCMEVLLGKPLIFADEPTSGLDASMAEKILVFLKRLANAQRNIVVTIHQPSSDVFSLFDNIMLLHNGHVAYYGPRTNASSFFSRLGYSCPPDYNPADFYIKTLAAQSDQTQQNGTESGKEHSSGVTLQPSHQTDIVKGYDNSPEKTECGQTIKELSARKQHRLRLNTSGRVSWLTEFKVCMWRNIKILSRNPILNHIRVVQHIAVAIFFGLSFLQLEEHMYRDISGCLFLIVYMLSLFGVFNNIQVLPTELPLFVREYSSGTYSISSWYIAKALIEVPACIILPLIFNLICYFMIFKNPVFTKFLFLWFISALAILTSTSIAYFVSVIGWEPLNTLAIAPTVYAPHFLFCGQFILIGNVKDWMLPFQETSWLRYSYEAAIITHFGDYGGQIDYYHTEQPDVEGQPYVSGSKMIEQLTMKEDNLWKCDVPALIGLTLGFHILAFLILFLRSKGK